MADDQDLAEAVAREDAVAAFLARIPMRDEEGALRAEFVEEISRAVDDWNAGFLRSIATELHEADIGDLIEALEPDRRLRLIELAGRDFDFAALNEVDDAVREEILEDLPPETVAEGVRELESDDAIELLQDLSDENKEQILDRLPAQDRIEIERGLLYPENSAGRRMQTDFISVSPTWTVGQTIDYMRETPDLPDRFYELYALEDGEMRGTVPLDVLLRTRRPVQIADIMDEDRRRILATDDQEEVARLFGKYNLVAAPVVDTGNRLVGVITVDDVVDVIEEEAEEDMRALGGVTADEELSDTVWTIVRARFPWLFVNMLTACLSAFVISRFEGALEKMVALAMLMPIVASMGGNAGTQTMTVAVRALATRELGRGNAVRVLRREVAVGFLNGLSFAVILGVISAIAFGMPQLGVVIGMAMVTVLASAALGGLVIPLVLDRFGVDPAVSAGPFVTTVTDVIGFFAFLGIATLWLGLA